MSQLKPRDCQEERTELMLTIRVRRQHREILSGGVNGERLRLVSRRDAQHIKTSKGFYPAASITIKPRIAAGSTEGWYGGGEGNPPSLTPLLRFEIRGVALAA